MVGMLGADVLYTKAVNNQSKGNGPRRVCLKSRCTVGWGIAVGGQVFAEALICDEAGLLEAGHPLLNLHVDPTVTSKVGKGVLQDNFVRNHGKREPHVIVSCHWGAIVKVLDVEGEELSVVSGGDAVEEALVSSEAGGGECPNVDIMVSILVKFGYVVFRHEIAD
jgi:hypothetical protein